MANPDRSIDPRILEAARDDFLSKPYDMVSLREICSKAGVTTGAFYNRYKNKEELFDALVMPTLALVEEYSNQTETASYTRLNEENLRRIWEMTSENQSRIIDMFYDNYDGFKLLLCHAEGTKYANFLHDFASDVTVRSLRFITEAHRRGMTPFVIEEEELHMLITAYWATMFEPIIHGLPREKAQLHGENVAKLFNWTAVLGF